MDEELEMYFEREDERLKAELIINYETKRLMQDE